MQDQVGYRHHQPDSITRSNLLFNYKPVEHIRLISGQFAIRTPAGGSATGIPVFSTFEPWKLRGFSILLQETPHVHAVLLLDSIRVTGHSISL